MPINVHCDCGKTLRVKDEYAGRSGKCPACGRRVDVPLPEPEPAADDDLYALASFAYLAAQIELLLKRNQDYPRVAPT